MDDDDSTTTMTIVEIWRRQRYRLTDAWFDDSKRMRWAVSVLNQTAPSLDDWHRSIEYAHMNRS